MSTSKAMRQSLGLRISSNAFLIFWVIIAAFPIAWIAIMSFKSPVDAFADNPIDVIMGPNTLERGDGISFIDIVLGLAVLYFAVRWMFSRLPGWVETYSPANLKVLGWLIGAAAYALVFLIVFVGILPIVLGFLNSILGPLGEPFLGLTTQHYVSVWVDNEFYRNFGNSLLVTAGVVTISLTVGTLAGYGLARSGSDLAFWLLILALIFRALPHSVLVAGYLPWFINSAEILRPIFGDISPTLYGQPWAVIAVLVAINQPFTIWMLRSFFQNIPAELDEAARVDGCSHFQAFRRVIMPVMWPGVITTGLFSFLLGYNDFLVTALLLDAQNQTMVPAIAG
jgi:trehalose/maltose transport system permease protein